MKYTFKKTEKSTVTLSFEIEQSEVEKHKLKAAEEISKDVKVPGFRPGHIPPAILEQHVDPKYILAHAYELAMQTAYAEAVMKEKLQVVARPEINVDKPEEDKEGKEGKSTIFKFTAKVAVLPEVKIKDHKEIKIKKEEIKIDAKEVEETMSEMQKYFTTWKDVEREVKKGDRVELDFEGFEPKEKDSDELKAIPNTASKNHPVIVGENSLIPGFEDEIVGMKKDEKKEFTLTFPKEYHNKSFQNKKVLFKVELKRIEEGQKPDFTEELVEKVTGRKLKVDEFKKELEDDIKARKEKTAKIDRENKYIEELLKRTDADVPDALIEEEVEYIIDEVKQDIEARGIPFDKFLEKTKTTHEDLHKKYKPEAEKRIKVRLAISHLITEEKIEVDDKEVEEQAKISKENPASIKNRLLLQKLFAKLLD